jgi:hypothetical protein
MTRARVLLTTATAVAALALLAGCSGSDAVVDPDEQSADEILAIAVDAVETAESVNLAGAAESDGETFEIDLSYAGEDAGGTVQIGEGEITLLKRGSEMWFKADQAFWESALGEQGAAVDELVGGRWIIGTDVEQFADLTDLTSKSFISDEVLEPDSDITVGETTEVDGEECVLLVSDDGELCVGLEDGRPLQITSGENDASVDFSYDEVEIEPAPAEDDTVDLAELGA